jgi:hypothetical protein
VAKLVCGLVRVKEEHMEEEQEEDEERCRDYKNYWIVVGLRRRMLKMKPTMWMSPMLQLMYCTIWTNTRMMVVVIERRYHKKRG